MNDAGTAVAQQTRRIVNLNVPKGGTWLLGRCIELLRGRHPAIPRLLEERRIAPNEIALWNVPIDRFRNVLDTRDDEYLVGHLAWHPEWEMALCGAGFVGVFVIRDPRDLLVSRVHWVRAHPGVRTECVGMSEDELTHYLIDSEAPGESPRPPSHRRGIVDTYRSYLPWRRASFVHTTRFEDLVGADGGGSEVRQRDAISAIALHLGVDLDDAGLERVAAALFGRAAAWQGTFRKGQIGSWREHFTSDHVAHFAQSCGSLLEELGYE